MRTPVLVVLIAAALILLNAGSSHAERHDGAFADGSSFNVGAEVEHSGGRLSVPHPVPRTSRPVEVVTTPACGRNGPEGSFGDDFCGASNRLCPPGQTFATTWTRTGDAAWVNGGSRCTAAAADAGPVVLPTVTEADLRRLPLPAGVVELQPRTGLALLHVPLVLRTGTDVVVRDTTVLGYPVTVRATPTTWTWDLGDGTTLGPTGDPGAP